MYLYATYKGREARQFVCEPLPSGGEWRQVAKKVERVEVWASNIEDSGADHYVLVAYDVSDREIGRKKVETY